MKIIIDAHGGDNAPLSILQGAAMAVQEYGVDVVLVGKEAELREQASKEGIVLSKMSFVEAETTMPVEADPTELTKTYKDSSLALAMKELAEGRGDAIVSAGSTGAIIVGATFLIKRIKGVKRPALGVVIPDTKGMHMLIDAGANTVCRPEMLLQFAIMGSVYMEQMMDVKNPRVGMINIGTEANKGLDLQIEASALLEQSPLNFIGNVESSQLPQGGCDVAVTDGFTGNIILKHTEGMAKFMKAELTEMFGANPLSSLGYLLVKKGMKAMSKKLNPSEYGGVPVLGVTKPVIKAHGSSDALAIKNAIRQAKKVVDQKMIPQIEEAMSKINERTQE